MSKSKFYDLIKDVVDERGVETLYKNGLTLYFPNTDYTYPFQCDGYMEPVVNGTKFRLIIEYKLDELLNDKSGKAKVLIQVIWYLKRFEIDGRIIPNVCLVGDKNECFALQTNPLLKYLDEDVDWKTAPSEAHAKYPDVVFKIANDEDINPFVFNVNENFSFKEVAEKIKDLACNIQRYVRVTEHNISNIFDYFCKNVLKSVTHLNGHDVVGIFMGVLNDPTKYYPHPTLPNILVCNGRNVNMDGSNFKSFFGYFDRNYTPQEKTRMTAIADRLIEDYDRRMKGDFWTPTLFVDYAHRMLESVLGEDWKEKYVVWDNCWGSGNLTRDYHFNELYCSTLFQSELDMGANYNREATKFQFDFLNEFIPGTSDTVQFDSKIPHGLHNALLQKKPIVFLLNPPYGTANNMGATGTSKQGIASTKINRLMQNDDMGACSQNLYAQFLYRIMKLKEVFGLTDCFIGIYSPALFLTGPSWKKFRKKFLHDFSYIKACQFKASHFADVSDNWGISFSVWGSGETTDKENFNYDLIDEINGEIKIIDQKTVYNVDNHATGNDWVKESVKGIATIDSPQLTSALKVAEKGYGQIADGAMGYTMFKGNNVDNNTTGVAMLSGMYANAHGISILDSNFLRSTALFAARKLIEKTWVNSKDEYLAPDETHPQFQEFVNDSMVFSLFHSSSNQSSLRQVQYKDRKWNIYNEFFWMGKEEIMQLASENNYDECYNDARTAKERYVYRKLQETTLSTETQAVLGKANAIVRSTFKFRELFNGSNPEYQIMNWDCGWYQIKALAREYGRNDLDEFNSLFKALADKMRPMVYELGFLKK